MLARCRVDLSPRTIDNNPHENCAGLYPAIAALPALSIPFDGKRGPHVQENNRTAFAGTNSLDLLGRMRWRQSAKLDLPCKCEPYLAHTWVDYPTWSTPTGIEPMLPPSRRAPTTPRLRQRLSHIPCTLAKRACSSLVSLLNRFFKREADSGSGNPTCRNKKPPQFSSHRCPRR